MEDETVLRFKFFIPEEFFEDLNSKVVISMLKGTQKYEYSVDLSSADIAALGKDKNGRYVIEQGVAAGEMTRDITIKFYDGEGNILYVNDYVEGIKMSATRSVADWCKRILDLSTNTKQRELATALATYGYYAQVYFEGLTDEEAEKALEKYGISLADISGVTADSIQQETKTEGADIGIKGKITQNMYFDSAVYLRIFFQLNAQKSIDDYTFNLTKQITQNGQTITVTNTVAVSSQTNSSGAVRYYIDITDIPAAYFDYEYIVTMTEKATGAEYTVTTSGLAYLKAAIAAYANDLDRVNMFKAVYLYNAAANAYFNK